MPPGPSRSCSCGETVACAAALVERANGVPVGTRFHYSCARCKTDFSVSSNGAIAFTLFAAVAISALGWFAIIHPPGAASPDGPNRWLGWVLASFGAAGWVMFGARIVARLRHPIRT